MGQRQVPLGGIFTAHLTTVAESRKLVLHSGASVAFLKSLVKNYTPISKGVLYCKRIICTNKGFRNLLKNI